MKKILNFLKIVAGFFDLSNSITGLDFVSVEVMYKNGEKTALVIIELKEITTINQVVIDYILDIIEAYEHVVKFDVIGNNINVTINVE